MINRRKIKSVQNRQSEEWHRTKRFRDKQLWSRCRTQSARMSFSSTVTAALADGKIQIRYKTML